MSSSTPIVNPWKNEEALEALRLQTENLSTQDDSLPQAHENQNKRIRVVHNVHQDDIHAIIQMGDCLFSGSKDGTIKKWDLEGKPINMVHPQNWIDYKRWITAMAPINENQWVSARRNGEAHLWDRNGNLIRELSIQHAPFPRGFDERCKDRNKHRISCLIPYKKFNRAPVFFAGYATQFATFEVKKNLIFRKQDTYTSENDWVYAIAPIDFDRLLVVTGTQLDFFSKERNSYDWKKSSCLIEPVERGKPRPFISAITPLRQEGRYGLAVFDGSVRVCDLVSGRTVFNTIEHQNRVWAIENIANSVFASCGDDGLIKLWDPRASQRSIATMRDNLKEKARVSNLKLIGDHELLSCSCPDDPKVSPTKGQFTFWDTRLLAK